MVPPGATAVCPAFTPFNPLTLVNQFNINCISGVLAYPPWPIPSVTIDGYTATFSTAAPASSVGQALGMLVPDVAGAPLVITFSESENPVFSASMTAFGANPDGNGPFTPLTAVVAYNGGLQVRASHR
jgi:hypothetical protein